MNEHNADTLEQAMEKDVYRYHPWLKKYGHRIDFDGTYYRVYYNGEPFSRAFYAEKFTKDGDIWFSNRMHQGHSDDCDKCGGTGISHYNPFIQCHGCGERDENERSGWAVGKGSGKIK
jgi:hypothetical protein